MKFFNRRQSKIDKAINHCKRRRASWEHTYKTFEYGSSEFESGVISGYGWATAHLEHIKDNKICRCPD